MAHTLYELEVRLCEIDPAIWRAIEISGASSLEDVHFAIQVAMGWTNLHLHQFVIGETSYGVADVNGAGDFEREDERDFQLQDLVERGDAFVYQYDFGDCWEHEVTIKKVETQATPPKPRCIGGARACPPEDCGGADGYKNLLEALRDPKHQEHESLVTWSNDFQPEGFVIPKTGLYLQKSMNELMVIGRTGDPDTEAELPLPESLVGAVLALKPMQRARLGAMIAGSLARELVEVRTVDALNKQPRPTRYGRKRARSQNSTS
jgi:hypothetical protein